MVIWFSLLAISFVSVVCMLTRRAEQRFHERWPAIDDDEFVRCCSPGTNREIALKVRRIISKQLNIPYEHIHPEQSFIDDFDA